MDLPLAGTRHVGCRPAAVVSPNTVRAYAFDLKDYFAYLTSRGLDWAHLRYDELAGFKPWLRLRWGAQRDRVEDPGGCGVGRDVPARYGSWQPIYTRFRRWALDGTFERMLAGVQTDADAAGDIDWLVSVDSTIVRAHQHAAGAEGGAENGRTTRSRPRSISRWTDHE